MQTTESPLFQASQSELKVNSLSVKVNPLDVLGNAFEGAFSQNIEETIVLRIRRILREIANTLSNEQVECITTEFQFIINCWLDEYEKDVFGGMTLKEVLNKK